MNERKRRDETKREKKTEERDRAVDACDSRPYRRRMCVRTHVRGSMNEFTNEKNVEQNTISVRRYGKDLRKMKGREKRRIFIGASCSCFPNIIVENVFL